MKTYLLIALLAIGGTTEFQEQHASLIDLTHWKLELPTGYTASDWKLSNFQKDRFVKPFFYLDSLDGTLVMEAYPAEGKSKATYTKTTLREQMQPGSSDVNWTMKQGGVLETEFKVTEMSKDVNGKYHRTILVQIDGKTSKKQTEELGLAKAVSMPFLKIYWQNEELYIVRRVLKDESIVGDALLMKKSWKENEGIYYHNKVNFDKVRLKLEVKKGKITILINDDKPIVLRDLSVGQWYFENYFTVGNYLQTKDEDSHSVVKYYTIDASHAIKKK